MGIFMCRTKIPNYEWTFRACCDFLSYFSTGLKARPHSVPRCVLKFIRNFKTFPLLIVFEFIANGELHILFSWSTVQMNRKIKLYSRKLSFNFPCYFGFFRLALFVAIGFALGNKRVERGANMASHAPPAPS